ncbi:MAG TPA: SPOR domain-containing protein [Clostridia bacterium]|nr:SPOR domain-containing protein [Clostridia bacterium]
MSENYDTEITLGIGRLVILFFGLVILCGVFLGVGYTLGRNAAQTEPIAAADGGSTSQPASGATKPTAGQSGSSKAAECPEGETCNLSAEGVQAQDLTFYKSVEQKDANPQLTPQEAAKPEKSSTPEMKVVTGTGYMVQVAAVSKREDAEVLTDALRRKQYPVVITNAPTDKLFHVQLGPFAELKDAESVKGRLVRDGYNPIVKR